MTSLLFGATSSPCSALLIKDKNAETYASIYPYSVKSIQNNCYMDDFLDSCKTLSEAGERVCQVVLINSTTNWVMHGWASNEPSVLNVLNETENSNETVSLANIGEDEERVLGLQWITGSDVFTFKFGETKIPIDIRRSDRKPSKREFLSAIMSLFDPLGFLLPVTIQARILMQVIWASHVKWDEKISDCDFERWKLRKMRKAVSNC